MRRIKLSTPPTAATTEIFDISEDTVAEFALEPADPYFVQMVTATANEDPPVEEDEPALIILDSGADASMVPYSFGGRGSPAGGNPPVLQDAQGNKIDGGTHRKFDFWFEAADGKRFAVREQCVVGNVQVPLLAVGKLLRRGWQIINDGELKLQEPFGRAAKVAFRHNSLALRGHIRAVTLSTPSPAAVRALTDNPRTLPAAPPVVPLPDYLKEIVGREGMHELPHGIKGHYAPEAFKLMDGRMWYDADVFSARTTLVKKANGSWIQIENSADERITLFRMESFGEGFFEGRGMAPKTSTRFAAESEDEPLTFLPPREPATPEQLKQPETPKPDEPEETEHAMDTDEGGYLEELAAGKAVEKAKKVFERAPLPVAEPPAVPSEAEVKAHRLTHIPYARWCSACVKTRARGDKHGSRKEVDRTPVVQVDFFFTTVDPDGRPEEEELPEHPCSLVAIDVDTRMVLAVPGPNKGGIALKRYVEELLRFTIALHDEEHIVLRSDGEPSIKAVVRATAEARASLGRRTTQRTTPTGDHQANGAAERAVQTVRRLGNTLVEDIEETYGKLPVGADLRLWAQPHAAFLYNRFHVCPRLQLTPYEATFGGKPYAGRLCIFGETVYGKMVTPYKEHNGSPAPGSGSTPPTAPTASSLTRAPLRQLR